MADTLDRSIIDREILEPVRKASEWTSPRGINTDGVPWRLWEKAKQLAWDPAELDFSQDARDWAEMSVERQTAISVLAQQFMIGEESVTLDIVPLIIALSDENRLEEVMYLTTFAFEEAKHVDFFHRWFAAVGADPVELEMRRRERMESFGLPLPPLDRTDGMFQEELPRVMRRVLVDRSPEAILDCAVTYNQFVEGCLAFSGYRVWGELFDMFGVLPGMREGLRLVRRDEGRHITFGTYLARRVVAAHPELLDFAKGRLKFLRDLWYRELTGMEPPAEKIDASGVTAQIEAARESGELPEGGEMLYMFKFFEYLDIQVEARSQVLERAATLTEEETLEDTGAEEAEADLLGV